MGIYWEGIRGMMNVKWNWDVNYEMIWPRTEKDASEETGSTTLYSN